MKYVALFRGINVGGKNIVKMASLKKLFEDLGFADVKTYIQSGNVVFCADMEPTAIVETIGAGFLATFGFSSAMTLRTAEEIAGAEGANPDVEHLYVYLLDGAPERDAVSRLTAGYAGPDMLRAGRREFYLLCHQSIRDAKLAVSLSKLKTPMTARNLKTIGKLHEMINA